jgi:hypothetical protein
MGAITVIAAQHAYAHFHSDKSEPEDRQPSPAASHVATAQLSPATRERLVQESRTQFETVLKHAAADLQTDLGISTDQINNLVKHLATEIVSAEMEHYRLRLSQLHEQADADMNGIRTEVTKHEADLKAKLADEIASEKQTLIKQIDAKLADAVGSFLVETLRHNIDLGNQETYLVQMLEEHKADFVKEVDDGSEATK